jgi:hypothetical protein
MIDVTAGVARMLAAVVGITPPLSSFHYQVKNACFRPFFYFALVDER